MRSVPGISDAHPFYQVDPTTRDVIFVEGPSSIAVQGDMDSQLVTFRVPRMFDNIDHQGQIARIHYMNPSGHGDVVDAFAAEIDPEDPEYLLIRWLVSASATEKSGKLRVSLEFCVIENNEYVYRWFTRPANFTVDENIMVTDKAAGVTTDTELRIQAALEKLEGYEIDADTLQQTVESGERLGLELTEKVGWCFC